MVILVGQKNQKSGKCDELSRKKPTPPRGVGGGGGWARTTLCRLLKSRQSKQPGHHVRQQTDNKRCLPGSSSLTSKFFNYFLPVK